jgi:hypothetical protein
MTVHGKDVIALANYCAETAGDAPVLLRRFYDELTKNV